MSKTTSSFADNVSKAGFSSTAGSGFVIGTATQGAQGQWVSVEEYLCNFFLNDHFRIINFRSHHQL